MPLIYASKAHVCCPTASCRVTKTVEMRQQKKICKVLDAPPRFHVVPHLMKVLPESTGPTFLVHRSTNVSGDPLFKLLGQQLPNAFLTCRPHAKLFFNLQNVHVLRFNIKNGNHTDVIQHAPRQTFRSVLSHLDPALALQTKVQALFPMWMQAQVRIAMRCDQKLCLAAIPGGSSPGPSIFRLDYEDNAGSQPSFAATSWAAIQPNRRRDWTLSNSVHQLRGKAST